MTFSQVCQVPEGQERQAEGKRSTCMDGCVHQPTPWAGTGAGKDCAELGPGDHELRWPPLSNDLDEGPQERTAGALSGSESLRGRPGATWHERWEPPCNDGEHGGPQNESRWYVVNTEGTDEGGDVRWSRGHHGAIGKNAGTVEGGVQPLGLRRVRGKAAATESDTGQGGETETDMGAVYTDLEADAGSNCVLGSEAEVVLGGSPKCVLLSGPENAAEYYGWSATKKADRFRFGFWPRRMQEGKP